MTSPMGADPARVRPTAEQRQAADPTRSIWATANAGTGKTRVLTDRVLRLLLSGAHPESILCLTFTKAAAAEMTERLEARLGQWAVADAPALAAELQDLTGELPDAAMLSHARRLFAALLELPRGLPIMTIHALAASLLRRFPLEAGTAPHFETLDERTARELLIEARAAMLAEAAANPDAPLGQAFGTLAETLGEPGLTGLLTEVASSRLALAAAMARHGGIDGLLAALHAALDLSPELTAEAVIERACRDGEYDAAALVAAGNALLASGGKEDGKRGHSLLTWLNAAPADRAHLFQTYCGCFLTKIQEPLKRLATKAVAEAHVRALAREAGRLVQAGARLKAIEVAARTSAILRVAAAALAHYERLKARRAGLDYDDLIQRAADLLTTPGSAAWVLYKLDQRLEHLLVDEAQDTSPGQWIIIERLVEEFFAGTGSPGRPRTLFVVGDEKQSIYGFQGADLASFEAVRERLRAQAGERLSQTRIELSFRSGQAILDLVDAVFADPMARRGLGDLRQPVRHRAWRRDDLASVELWPLLQPTDLPQIDEPWPLPDRPHRAEDAQRRLATGLAQRVRDLCDDPSSCLASTGGPTRPGDILILLARRGRLQELIIRAVRQAGIAVAGADRLGLTDHIAVQDLMALGRVALLPEDELSLASLLKSPFFDLGDDELMVLAEGRGRTGLLERLRELAAARRAPFAATQARLGAWLARADFMPPFEFFTSVLGERDAAGCTMRQRCYARLGNEAAEPIEAFLGQALAYEQGHPASLQGFIRWLELGRSELKRDPEQRSDAVRVMTVHGAKGLEAPIVILADAGPWERAPAEKLVWHRTPGLPLARLTAAERDPLTAEACAAAVAASADERRRLLYVALTRARDRLIVAGCLGRRAAKSAMKATEADGEALTVREPAWHELVARAMDALPGITTLAGSDRLEAPVRHYATGRPPPPGAGAVIAVPPSAPLPDWSLKPVPAEPARQRGASPSQRGASDGPAAAGGEAGTEARTVGVLVHRLLQLLPMMPPPARPATLERLIGTAGLDPKGAEAQRIGRTVLEIMALPELAPLFGPAARTEQPIAGTLDGRVVSGQIDRMVVLPDRVLVVDFKTGRRVPAIPEATPIGYLAQMAAYSALLADLYPGHAIRCGLLWAETGSLVWLPPVLLERVRATTPP